MFFLKLLKHIKCFAVFNDTIKMGKNLKCHETHKAHFFIFAKPFSLNIQQTLFEKSTHVNKVSIDVVTTLPVSVQSVGELHPTVIIWQRRNRPSAEALQVCMSSALMSDNIEQIHTGQYVNVTVLAFVVGVIWAVSSDAHVDCTCLHFLKHNRMNKNRVNASEEQNKLQLRWCSTYRMSLLWAI